MSTTDINGQVWLGSERVDKAPLTAGTTGDDTTDGYAQEMVKQLVERTVADNIPRITDGFRIEIPTQATSPGDFTMHNGIAFDRWGRIVENAGDYDAAKTVNLPLPSTTYFVEVEVVKTAAIPDARAFWNPEYDNGNDPSGDVRPPGREYKRNVATRWVPDWQIVTNTVGFAYTSTSPDSIRIPVAILTTDASGPPRITAGTVVARTVLIQSMAAASATARCVSTRLLPDSGAATIDGETVGIVYNDRENNILSLAAGVATAKALGSRVIHTDVGSPLFLAERYGSTLPLPLPSTGGPFPTSTQQDCRPRQYQPNESRGMAYLQDQYAASGMSDAQLTSLKAHLDALGAKIRDMEWGGMVQPDPGNPQDFGVGQFAPANGWPLAPRWYDRAGSIAGGKSITVSVGDGVLSYGDYNTNGTYFSSPEEAIQAAVDKIAEAACTSGVLYIKRAAAPYDPAATINIPAMTGFLRIVGDGVMTALRSTGAFPVFTMAAGALVQFEHITIGRSGGSGAALSFGAAGVLVAESCDFNVVVSSGTLAIRADNCVFRATAGSSGVALRGLLLGRASNCTLTSNVNASTSYAVQANTGSGAQFYDCEIATSGVALTAAVYQDTSAALTFDGCVFNNISTPTVAWAGVYIGTSSAGLNMTRCSLSGAGGVYGLVSATNLTRGYFANCTDVTFGPNAAALELLGTTASKSYTVRDCKFTQESTSGAKNGYAISFRDVDGVTIDNVQAINCDIAVYGDGTNVKNVTVRKLVATNSTATAGKLGVKIDATNVDHVTLDDCDVSGLDDSAPAEVAAAWIECTNGTAVTVRGCNFHEFGSATCGSAYGVRTVGGIAGVIVESTRCSDVTSLATTKAISIEDDGTNGGTEISISDNAVTDISGLGDVDGIDVSTYIGLTIANNKLRNVGDATATGEVCAIRWGWNVAVATTVYDMEGASLSGNIINGVESDGTEEAIGLYGAIGVSRCTLTGNSVFDCTKGGGGGTGIWLDAQGATGGPNVRNVIINGNVCAVSDPATFTYNIAIRVNNVRVATDNETQFILSNNQAWEFEEAGIAVDAAGGQTTSDVNITGNTAKSSQADCIGIRMADCTGFTVSTNNVSLTAASGASNGILIGSGGTAADGTIVGNRVFVDTPDAGNYGLSVTGDGITVTGNFVRTDNDRCIYADGTGDVGCIMVSSNTVAFGAGAVPNFGIDVSAGNAVKRAATAEAGPPYVPGNVWVNSFVV